MSRHAGLGRYIKSKRESLGLTARSLAASVEIDPPVLSRLETGVMKSLPEPELLDRLASALNVTVSDLLEAAGYLDSSDRQTVSANPFDSADLRWHVVEGMRTLDMGREYNEWMMTMFLRELRGDDVPRLKR